MKTWHKILIILILLFLLAYLLVLYINTSLIPVKLKDILINNISEKLQKETSIDSLKFSIAKGFVLTGLKIYEGPKEDNKLFLKSDEISFALLVLPSLKKLQLIIPRISIDAPSINIIRAHDGVWNFSSIFAAKAEDEKPSRINISIKSLSFDGAEVVFKDYYQDREFHKRIKGLRGSAGLSLPSSFSVNCIGKIDESSIKVIAKYSIPKKDLSAEVETKNLEFSDYWNNYIATWLESSKVHSGLCNTSLKLHLKNFETLSVKGDVAIEGLKADINNIVLMGDYKTTGSLSTHMNDFSRLTYNLKLEVNKANIATSIKALKSIEDIKGSASLSEKKWIFKNLSCSSYGSQASIRGNITSPHKDFTIDAELESILQLKNIRDLVNMDLRTGEAKVKTKIIYKKDKSYHVSGKSDIEDLTFRQKDITIKGDFVIEGESSGTAGDWEKLKYKGTMKFSNAIIEGSSPLALISDASGNATFDTNRIFIKQFEGKTAGASIFLRGDIRRQATGPHFDVNINTNNISLAKLISSLPESAKNKFKGIDIKGSCSIDLNLSGIAGKSDSYNYTGKLLLRESTLALPYWPHKLSNISCDLNFEKQKISWQNFYFDINDIRYNSYGRLINFAHPEVAINLKSKDLEAVAEIRTDKNNIINLSKLSVRYRKSTLSASGKLSNIKSAYANLAGNLNLDLKDAPYIFKSRKETLDKFKAEGILNVKFTMKGPLKDPASWTLFAEGSSGNLRAWGLSLDDFYFDYRMKDKFIDIPVIVAYPYSGIININSRANLKTEEQPYIINIDIKDIDLQQLIKDSSSKDKKIKGTFAAKSVLNGYLKQGGSMQGSGWLQVSDGYLWEFPIMHDMMEVVFMMPPEYVTLTDAFGNFTVRNNRIHTEDFKMLSKTASLLWVGSLGFDTTLDFNITGRFAEDIIKQTTEPGKIASAILREAGNLIMEIRLTGTLAKPTYQIIPFPLKRIFQEKVVDSLRTIFGNMSE